MLTKRDVLFVQGGGKGTHDDWDRKLVESLRRELGEGYEIHYPRMPSEDNPSYGSWKAALENVLEKLHDGAILVGHSVGGTILIRMLAEHPSSRQLTAVLLIAVPFVGKGGWSFDELQLPADLGARLPRDVPIHFFHGLADETAPPPHADLYARAVPQAHIHRLPGRDHQLNDDLSEVAASILALS
jgi:pimeloyl-ACP methyl ester carboxylesterase